MHNDKAPALDTLLLLDGQFFVKTRFIGHFIIIQRPHANAVSLTSGLKVIDNAIRNIFVFVLKTAQLNGKIS